MGDRELGAEVTGWQVPRRPVRAVMEGRLVRLEPLEADRHAFDLHAAFQGHDALWDFMANGPYFSASAYHRWARENESGSDQVFYALCDVATGTCGGVASYLRIAPEAGSDRSRQHNDCPAECSAAPPGPKRCI